MKSKSSYYRIFVSSLMRSNAFLTSFLRFRRSGRSERELPFICAKNSYRYHIVLILVMIACVGRDVPVITRRFSFFLNIYIHMFKSINSEMMVSRLLNVKMMLGNTQARYSKISVRIPGHPVYTCIDPYIRA